MLFGSDSAEAVMAQVSEVSSESSDTTTNPGLEPVIETPAMTSPMSEQGVGDHGMNHGSSSGDYIDINTWGSFHGFNHNSEHDELVGGRTAITTEAMVAYNGLRAWMLLRLRRLVSGHSPRG